MCHCWRSATAMMRQRVRQAAASWRNRDSCFAKISRVAAARRSAYILDRSTALAGRLISISSSSTRLKTSPRRSHSSRTRQPSSVFSPHHSASSNPPTASRMSRWMAKVPERNVPLAPSDEGTIQLASILRTDSPMKSRAPTVMTPKFPSDESAAVQPGRARSSESMNVIQSREAARHPCYARRLDPFGSGARLPRRAMSSRRTRQFRPWSRHRRRLVRRPAHARFRSHAQCGRTH